MSSVTPWEVLGKVDYNKLVKQFGINIISDELKVRFEKVTGHKLHPWLKRDIFFAHRDLGELLNAKEMGKPIYIYSGRGPSSNSLTFGHVIPFTFTKWLQDVFDCVVIIQISDDEKYYFKDMEFDDIYKLGFENAKDIMAFGFNPKKTFIFSNRDYRLNVPKYEILVSTMKKHVTAKQVAKIFGFGEKINVKNNKDQDVEKYVYNENVTVGMMDWPFYQTAASFSEAFPNIFDKPAHCLVSYAVDQDVYFRMARDVSSKMGLLKPSSIISIFLDPLNGVGKMSSSTGAESTLFLTDTPEQLKKKIMKYSFSAGGGDGSLSDHRKYGGNPDIDIACKYLKYFEYDDDKLNKIYTEFKKGILMCSDTKKILVEKLTILILDHQNKRKNITDECVKEFYALNKF